MYQPSPFVLEVQGLAIPTGALSIGLSAQPADCNLYLGPSACVPHSTPPWSLPRHVQGRTRQLASDFEQADAALASQLAQIHLEARNREVGGHQEQYSHNHHFIVGLVFPCETNSHA